jgi:type IV secretory pathway TrbD component
MARSGILPSIFARTYREHGTPYWSTISCSVIAYCISLLGWLSFDTKQFTEMLFALYQLGAIFTYTFQLMAYLILWYKYRSVPRAWSNPLGPVGAVLALIIFSMTLVSVVFFQPYTWQPVLMLVCWFIPLMCYYWRYARHRRSASPEEICALFILHTVKINRLRVLRVKKKARKDAATAGGSLANGSKLSGAAGVIGGAGGTANHRHPHLTAAGSGFGPASPGAGDPNSVSGQSSEVGSHTRQFMARFNVRNAHGGVVGRPGVALVSTSPAVVASHGNGYRPPVSLNVSAPYIKEDMNSPNNNDQLSPSSPEAEPSNPTSAFASLGTPSAVAQKSSIHHVSNRSLMMSASGATLITNGGASNVIASDNGTLATSTTGDSGGGEGKCEAVATTTGTTPLASAATSSSSTPVAIPGSVTSIMKGVITPPNASPRFTSLPGQPNESPSTGTRNMIMNLDTSTPKSVTTTLSTAHGVALISSPVAIPRALLATLAE